MSKLKKWWPVFMPVSTLFIAIIMYAVTCSQLQYGAEFQVVDEENADTTIGEITKGRVIQQSVDVDTDVITQFSIMFATYNRSNTDVIHVEILNSDGKCLYQHVINTEGLADNSFYSLPFDTPFIEVGGQTILLRITSENGFSGNAITAYGNTSSDEKAQVNGETIDSAICLKIAGKNKVPYTQMYWSLMGTLIMAVALYSVWVMKSERLGRGTLAGNLVRSAVKYWFLLRQLVARDFKTKYKRSVLGMLWSLLNPLMTMTVQYIVFSRLFRFEIQNYPVYLLSGIVFFNYMSDATSQAMMCIVQNASLINKVYMPKYIYPFSRVLSCGINFLLSLVALYIMILASGITITANHLFLLYGILCTFIFTVGISLFLSALMVFFRDIQFLYGVFLQLWIYLTPLFYPETILPDWVMRIVKLNPMYHFIRFVRIIILNGILPEFKAWVYCAIFAIVPFILGYWVFRKLQSKFILYI